MFLMGTLKQGGSSSSLAALNAKLSRQDAAGGGWCSSGFWFLSLSLTFSAFLFSYVFLRLEKSDLKAGRRRSNLLFSIIKRSKIKKASGSIRGARARHLPPRSRDDRSDR
jgi:hypothetical protein